MKGLPLTALTIAAKVHATPIPVCRNSKLCINIRDYYIQLLSEVISENCQSEIIELGYVNDIPAVSILGSEILSQGRKLLLADYA